MLTEGWLLLRVDTASSLSHGPCLCCSTPLLNNILQTSTCQLLGLPGLGGGVSTQQKSCSAKWSLWSLQIPDSFAVHLVPCKSPRAPVQASSPVPLAVMEMLPGSLSLRRGESLSTPNDTLRCGRFLRLGFGSHFPNVSWRELSCKHL